MCYIFALNEILVSIDVYVIVCNEHIVLH